MQKQLPLVSVPCSRSSFYELIAKSFARERVCAVLHSSLLQVNPDSDVVAKPSGKQDQCGSMSSEEKEQEFVLSESRRKALLQRLDACIAVCDAAVDVSGR